MQGGLRCCRGLVGGVSGSHGHADMAGVGMETVTGLWCGSMASRGASAWTHGHGMWDTAVSSTATPPCTETHLKQIT